MLCISIQYPATLNHFKPSISVKKKKTELDQKNPKQLRWANRRRWSSTATLRQAKSSPLSFIGELKLTATLQRRHSAWSSTAMLSSPIATLKRRRSASSASWSSTATLQRRERDTQLARNSWKTASLPRNSSTISAGPYQSILSDSLTCCLVTGKIARKH